MPVPLLIGAVALSAVGTVMNVAASQKAASANAQIAAGQQQANNISLQALQVDAQRRQLETIRRAQVARAQSTAVATSQNAQLGSGLQGAQAQISGESNYNVLGINQNLDFGKEMGAVNQQISQARISLAGAEGMSGWGTGFSSLGNSLFNSYGAATRLAGGFGNNSYGNPSRLGTFY